MRDTKPNLPEISNSDLSALLQGSDEMLSPFSQEIYIGKQSIVGMRFQGGAAALVSSLKPGDRISFLREPNNEYDARAIMAVDEQGRKLGYIPRRENLVMSALMDHGKVFYGVIPDLPREEYAYSRKYPKGRQGTPEVEAATKARSRSVERRALREFSDFVGFLPIVSHGINGNLRRALEEAFGVLLGKPMSNLIIDTEEMAENHLPAESTYKLDSLVRKLRIHVHGDSHAERCCRRTWELYRRMDKSKLD